MSNESVESGKPKYVSTSLVFSGAMSGNPTHNYLNQAYHDANLHFLSPAYEMHWRVPAIIVPLAVRKLLHVDEIAGNLKASIADARQIIEERKFYLDTELTRRIHYLPDGPHPWVHPSIKVERHQEQGYAPGWDYTFNGYNLAVRLLDDYEKFIDEMVAIRRSAFTRIAHIHQMARHYRESVSLVDSEMTFHDMKQSFSAY